MTDDLLKRADLFLNQCGSCDYGVLVPCTCPKPDYRPVMLDLVREVERLRAAMSDIAASLDRWALECTANADAATMRTIGERLRRAVDQ